jgi:hypothetical protein
VQFIAPGRGCSRGWCGGAPRALTATRGRRREFHRRRPHRGTAADLQLSSCIAIVFYYTLGTFGDLATRFHPILS